MKIVSYLQLLLIIVLIISCGKKQLIIDEKFVTDTIMTLKEVIEKNNY